MFRQLVTEALDKNNTIARSIIKKMDHANWKNIAEMDAPNHNFIKNICVNLSQKFDEADEETQKEIIEKIYNKIHTVKEIPELEENQPTLSQSELKQRIIDYVKTNGAILFPLEQAAEKLAQELSATNEEREIQELTEATLSDIPHEIDDQIHNLKDMRFDTEETKKNWDLAGMDTQPLEDIKDEINNLISVMYQKGAELADQEISKSISDKVDEEK